MVGIDRNTAAPAGIEHRQDVAPTPQTFPGRTIQVAVNVTDLDAIAARLARVELICLHVEGAIRGIRRGHPELTEHAIQRAQELCGDIARELAQVSEREA